MTLADIDRYDPDVATVVGDRAVVVGGSVAGLCAARVLVDAFDEVVVLERDALPDEPAARDGAPQTSHPHALLEAGRATMEDLFSGFGERLLAAGGLLLDAGRDMVYYDEGGFVADTETRLPTYSASRALVEHVVREQVGELDAVELRGERSVADFRFDEGDGAVTGVVFRDRNGEEQSLSADLVVDASGRTSRTPAWLADHGYGAPPTDQVEVGVRYSTIRVERPVGDRRVLFVPPSAPRTRGGAAIPVEGGRWEVIVQGMHGEETPTEPDPFVEFVDGLPLDALGELVREQRWASEEIDYYPYPSSLRRRYERLDRFPDGLVVTGDAVASFNPIYGQGMSVAALDAVALHHALAGGLDDLAPRFFDRMAPAVDTVWQVAVGNDFAFPGTTGDKPAGTDLFNRYVSRLLRRAHADPALSEAFLRVLRLERPPTSLLRPEVAWRTLRPSGLGLPGGLRRSRRADDPSRRAGAARGSHEGGAP